MTTEDPTYSFAARCSNCQAIVAGMVDKQLTSDDFEILKGWIYDGNTLDYILNSMCRSEGCTCKNQLDTQSIHAVIEELRQRRKEG